MDHRDRMAMHGSDLDSLPDVEIDTDSMTATFYAEAETDAAPAREKSNLELRGEQIDERISNLIDSAIDKLVEKKWVKPGSGFYPGWNIHFPKQPEGHSVGDRWGYNASLRDMLADALRTKSSYNFFKGYLSVEVASRYDGMRYLVPHTVSLTLDFGPRYWVQLDKDNRTRPGIRLWFKKNGGKVFSLKEIRQDDLPYYMTQGSGPKVPFQIGIGSDRCLIREQEDEKGLGFFQRCKLRASKGWDMVSTGGMSFSRVGRSLNKIVNGETTKAQYEQMLRDWLVDHDYNMEEWPDASMDIIQMAQKELGNWVLRFLEPLPVEHVLHLQWEVCGTCEGKGKHVNPSIDAHGITSEEFSEDPDFAEEYFSGRYDVGCYECGGRSTSLVIDRKRTSEAALKAANDWIEDRNDSIREQEAERRMGA